MTDFMMMQRRDALKSLLAISAAGALAACVGEGKTAEAGTKKLSSAPKLLASEMALVSAVAQTIIPKTDTAGAVEAGVPAVIQSLFTEWGDDNYRTYWRAGLDNLEQHFIKTGGQTFAKMTPSQQANLLGKYDAKAYSEDGFDDFYKAMKSTIATAYYMSEPGATEELAYEAVPGEWRGCVPLSEFPKTWAT
ncbi:MAG: gluconate 2-dehydrogenase subunit 3 family protein [Litorimonas sp.]